MTSVDRRGLARPGEPTFADFRRMALDESLTPFERIGFPDSYRAGAEGAIVADISAKLPALSQQGRRFLDIGPGCSELPRMLLEVCSRQGHEAVLVDSPEMLGQLPDGPRVVKVAGAFPDVALPERPFDAILAYSVLQYVFAEGDVFAFMDRCLALLGGGGALLLGDVPNASKRARFFSSAAGVAFHRRFMNTEEPPPRELTHPEPGQIDDEIVLALLAHARAAGCDAYVLPLGAGLPLADRREDVLVVRP